MIIQLNEYPKAHTFHFQPIIWFANAYQRINFELKIELETAKPSKPVDKPGDIRLTLYCNWKLFAVNLVISIDFHSFTSREPNKLSLIKRTVIIIIKFK